MKKNNYNKVISDFSEIYLEDSYVLELNENGNCIEFIVELVLCEGHNLYKTPKEGEAFFYKKGKIIFPAITSIKWLTKTFSPTKDLNGEIDYGNIDYFICQGNEYHLGGDWGEVFIESQKPTIIW